MTQAKRMQPLRNPAVATVRAPRRRPPYRVLCVLPRRLAANPLRQLLRGYELAVAGTRTAALRQARHTAYDLYVVYAPLGWADAAEICRGIRDFDAHTPMILYSSQPSAAERSEALAQRSIHAYVARSDDSHNLAGTAGQLIMLAELRSIEAVGAGVEAIVAHIARRLAARAGGSGNRPQAPGPRSLARLKIEACRIFGTAGGSRANFERLWPSLYDAALQRRSAAER
jgi:CheY-like chemotaxis protein